MNTCALVLTLPFSSTAQPSCRGSAFFAYTSILPAVTTLVDMSRWKKVGLAGMVTAMGLVPKSGCLPKVGTTSAWVLVMDMPRRPCLAAIIE